MKRKLVIAVVGPTASGKSAFSVQLAEKIGGEILCVDSTTVYRGLDIGSSKPTAEEQKRVPHHLLDLLAPNEPFSAYHFVQLAEEAIADVQSRNKIPILVGGTYFYLRAVQKGMYPSPIIPADVIESIEREFIEEDSVHAQKLHAEIAEKDPETAKAIHPNDRYRCVRALAMIRTTNTLPSQLKQTEPVPASDDRLWMKYAITVSRHQLNQNIVRRTEKMLEAGLVKETAALLEKYPNARSLQSIGYAEAVATLTKKITEKQLRNEVIEKTRQFAKRQLTWLRSDPEIRFIDFRDLDRVALEIGNLQFALGENVK